MLWWARWFTTNLECAPFGVGTEAANTNGGRRVPRLLKKKRRETRRANFLQPRPALIFNSLVPRYIKTAAQAEAPRLDAPLIPLNIYCRDNSLISLSRSYTILRPPLCRRPCVGRPWRTLCKADLPQPLLHSHPLGSATTHPARSARWGGTYPYGRGTPVRPWRLAPFTLERLGVGV